jgi:hypothetical protein
MLEERIRGMICAEGHAHGGDGGLRLAIAPDKGDELLAKVGIENGLDVAAMKGMRGLAVEREAVDGIDAEKFNAARVDEIG